MELVALLHAVDDLALELFAGSGEGGYRFVKLFVEGSFLSSDGGDALTAQVVCELSIDQMHAFLQSIEVSGLVEVL